LTERGALELSRHDFRAALADARRVRALAPEVNKPFGVLVDALVELGRYRQAGRTLQAMIDRKPTSTPTRASPTSASCTATCRAPPPRCAWRLPAGGDVPENAAYVQALLGDLELVRGRPAAPSAPTAPRSPRCPLRPRPLRPGARRRGGRPARALDRTAARADGAPAAAGLRGPRWATPSWRPAAVRRPARPRRGGC